MAKADLIEIGLVFYPGAQMSAVLGMTDLFELANRTAARKSQGAPPKQLRASHWRTDQPEHAPVRVFDSHPDASGVPEVYVVPPALGDPISREAITVLAGCASAMAPAACWLRSAPAPSCLARPGCWPEGQ